MTIRRQYQLPNCSLVLDGLSINPEPGNEETMSLLVNAECRISGLERSLNGGYNFFAALVRAVSQYGQEVLSGFAHPQVIEGEPLLVHINPGEGPYHHLVIQPEIADLGDTGDGRAIDIKLSAVQLFDLTEAVDQFFDDNQTLPELAPALSPLPRRFVRTDEPLSDRALPAILGVGGLVAATMAMGLLPLPALREPAIEGRKDAAVIQSADIEGAEPPTGDGSIPVVDGIAAANTSSALWEKAPRITDKRELALLQSGLQTQLDEAADSEANFADPLAYQVAVNEAGEVVGFQFNNDAALRDVDKTPLPKLAGANAGVEGLEDDAIAEYAVDFDANGIEVSPWDQGTTVATEPAETATKAAPEPIAEAAPINSEPTEGKENAARKKPAAVNSSSDNFAEAPPATLNSYTEVEALNNELKRTIVENRKQPRVGKEAATYRVRIKEDGTVTGYQAVDDNATSAIDETPLASLVESAPKGTPSVDYRVVFTERGVVEVSPWWGWSFYE